MWSNGVRAKMGNLNYTFQLCLSCNQGPWLLERQPHLAIPFSIQAQPMLSEAANWVVTLNMLFIVISRRAQEQEDSWFKLIVRYKYIQKQSRNKALLKSSDCMFWCVCIWFMFWLILMLMYCILNCSLNPNSRKHSFCAQVI